MGRKCSHCESTGHNSRTCCGYGAPLSPWAALSGSSNDAGLRLFGVQLDLAPLPNSSSASSTSSPSSSIPSPSSSSSSSIANHMNMTKSFSLDSLSPCFVPKPDTNNKIVSAGYLSDGLIIRSQDKRKGVPWTEEEHRTFLIGLERLGKGDWRGIAKNYVTTRTPTQVASHAQKYFLRQSCLDKKKRRSSLFDMVRSNDAARDWRNQQGPFPGQQNISPLGLSFFGRSIGTLQMLQLGMIKLERTSVAGPDLDLSLAVPPGPREASRAAATGSLFIGPTSVTY